MKWERNILDVYIKSLETHSTLTGMCVQLYVRSQVSLTSKDLLSQTLHGFKSVQEKLSLFLAVK